MNAYVFCIFSSPEPLGSQGELVVYPCSGVPCRRCRYRRQQFQTSSPLISDLTLGQGGMKVYINGTGHRTKMAAMTIYDKTFKILLLQNQKFYDLES